MKKSTNLKTNTKIYIVSDLHLEFATFHPPLASQLADVIVLAGDIWLGDRGIKWAREQWPDKPIIYVAGNHEFYGYERSEALLQLKVTADRYDVHFLEQEEVRINGTRFLGATLWTDFKLFGEDEQLSMMNVGQAVLSDFSLISEGSEFFSPEDAVELFKSSVSFISDKLGEPYRGATVIVTHHLPSQKSVAKRFLTSPVSACFASKLDHFMGYAELWVHGHTHDSFDYDNRGTRVVCNPRGYFTVGGIENRDFDPGLIYEVSKRYSKKLDE